jgi:NADH-quinone oxidoreductase subunit C
MPDVAADQWHEEMAARAAGGRTYLDVLTVVDRGEQLEVIARVVDVEMATAELLSTRIPADAPDVMSVVDVFRGANWHEREAAELFGVRFVGHPDPRPLVTDGTSALLRKSTPLTARVQTPWPGAEPTSRRRSRVPGVPEQWSAGTA